MEEIIAPVDRELLRSELTEEHFLRTTSKGGNQLYLVRNATAPNLMREIGRLREEAFRSSGGGTGKEADIDQYDLSENGYQQLLVWDPEDQEIVAGYRLLKCAEADRDEQGRIISATSHLFNLSEDFTLNYLPITLELGRSFVQPKYQRGAQRKGLFALDNLWDGLAAVMVLNPDLKYMFGKVTMYPHYHREARNLILAFLRKYFPDPDHLVSPIAPLVSAEELADYANYFADLPYKEAHQKLTKEVRQRGELIPPLINSYMSLTRTMRTFGTAVNAGFGGVEETGILMTFADVDPARKERYTSTFEESRTYHGPDFRPKT
jgi:hypothetical protein